MPSLSHHTAYPPPPLSLFVYYTDKIALHPVVLTKSHGFQNPHDTLQTMMA